MNDTEDGSDHLEDEQREFTQIFNGFQNGPTAGGKQWQVCYLNSLVCGLSCLRGVQTWVSKFSEQSTQSANCLSDPDTVTGQLIPLLVTAQGSASEGKVNTLDLLKQLRTRFPLARYKKTVPHDTHEAHDRINEFLLEEKVQVESTPLMESTPLTGCLRVEVRTSRQCTQCGTGTQSNDAFQYIMVTPGKRSCKLGSLLKQYCQIGTMPDYFCENSACKKKQLSQVKYDILKITGSSLVVRVNRRMSDVNKNHTKVFYEVQQDFDTEEGQYEGRLRAVEVHIGYTAKGGHYMAYMHMCEGAHGATGYWVLLDDDKAARVSEADVLSKSDQVTTLYYDVRLKNEQLSDTTPDFLSCIRQITSQGFPPQGALDIEESVIEANGASIERPRESDNNNSVGTTIHQTAHAADSQRSGSSTVIGGAVQQEGNSALEMLGWKAIQSLDDIELAKDFANGLRQENEMLGKRSRLSQSAGGKSI